MVSTAWVAGKLNPYARWVKLAAVLLTCLALFAAGWVVNGWRLGEASATKEAARQTALTARQAKAMQDALEAVTASQAALAAARATNAQLVRAAGQRAPTAPQYACRELPLPDDYLEAFRK
jgi:hypothetical protein